MQTIDDPPSAGGGSSVTRESVGETRNGEAPRDRGHVGPHEPRKRRRKRHSPFLKPAATIPPAGRPNGAAGSPAHTPSPADEPPRAAPRRPQTFYGAIDLGTNNCRLLVATPRERGFRVVDAFSRIVRLGEGLSQTGRLSGPAMERAIEALAVCASKLNDRGVTRVRAVATEACRYAENGAEFVERVRAATGLDLEIVSQETEARLAVSGCASLVDPNANGAILFDIGGGSSELVWIDLSDNDGPRRRISDRIRSWTSLPVGVVTLSERHGGEHVPRDVFETMVLEVSELLALLPDVAALDAAVASGGVHMLGTSGTVTTLAGIHLGLKRYDRRQVDGLWMNQRQIDDVVDQLVETDYAGRIANPCIGGERADLVIAGCAILEAIRRRWRCDRLRVADRGLREGMLVELMSRDRVWQRRSPAP